MFLFYLEIVNKIRQVSISISEFTYNIQQPCGKCHIKFIYQFTTLNFQILLHLYWKLWKTVVQACKLLRSLSEKPWGSSKEFSLIYYFSLFDEWGGNKIYQFLSFLSLFFENFDWGMEVYHFMDLRKGTRELTQI